MRPSFFNLAAQSKGGASLKSTSLRHLFFICPFNGLRLFLLYTWILNIMAPSIKKTNPPRKREASDAGLIQEAPRPIRKFNCRDLGTNPTTNDNAEHQNKVSRIISGIDNADTKERYEVEVEDNKISSPNSAASSVTPPEKKIIHWQNGDPANPYNWSSVYLTPLSKCP